MIIIVCTTLGIYLLFLSNHNVNKSLCQLTRNVDSKKFKRSSYFHILGVFVHSSFPWTKNKEDQGVREAFLKDCQNLFSLTRTCAVIISFRQHNTQDAAMLTGTLWCQFRLWGGPNYQ